MLPPEQWMLGLTIGQEGTTARWLLMARGNRWVGKCVQAAPAHLIGLGEEGTLHEDDRLSRNGWHPLGYASLGRSPVEGEPERMVRIDGLGLPGGIIESRIGDTYEWRNGEHGWKVYHPDGDNVLFEASCFSPLAPLSAPAEEEQERTEAEIRESLRERGVNVLEPSGGCLRVAAVRDEFMREWSYVDATEAEEFLEAVCITNDRWRPRLPEFEPCGDCPECLEVAWLKEIGAERWEREGHLCPHGWRFGTACPSCPTGRAR